MVLLAAFGVALDLMPAARAQSTGPVLSGTVAEQRYQRGQAITPLVLPAATGGTGTLTYSLSPSLPAGLSLDLATRTVSGTPSEVLGRTNFTWKVTDGAAGEDSLTFFLRVTAEAGIPNAPTLTSVVPGSAPEQLVVTFSWSGPCAILGPTAGYTVEYRKLTSSWRSPTLVTASSPNDKNSGAFAIFDELGSGPVTGETFTINSSSAGQTNLGQIGVALDPEPYEIRASVYSGVGGCDAYSLYSNVVRSTPLSRVPLLDATVADQVYVQGVAITDLVLPAATGGNAPLSYALVGALLPSGLGYTSATRTLSGTPTALQSATTYTWRVTDRGGQTAEDTFTIEVTPAPLALSGTVAQQRYTRGQAITPLVLPAATGGTAPLTYALSPSTLPAGVQFDGATRTVSGTPTELFEPVEFTWKVTDSAQEEDSLTFLMTVNAEVGVPNAPTLTGVVPGSAPEQLVVTFSWSGPSCPILGTRAGYTVEYRKLTSSWRPAALVTASSPNDVNSGAFAIFEELGAGPIAGKVFTINSSSAGQTTLGQIGVALDPEPYEVRVLVSSGVGGCDADSLYSNVVRSTPVSGAPVLDAAVADQSYVQGVAITDLVLPAASGGNAPLTYQLLGALPAGLGYDSATRTLSGMPTGTQAATTYTWKVTDAGGDADEDTFTIEVTPAPLGLGGTVERQRYTRNQAITPLVLPAATGGTAPLTYALSPSLPGGLSLDIATRTVSGTPTELLNDTYFSWEVTDNAGEQASVGFFMSVKASAGIPDPPNLTSVVPGSAPEQLVVTFSWSGPCPILGASAGYAVEYRKLTSSWRPAAFVSATSPNDANSGAFTIFEELGAGPITAQTFTINSSSAGQTTFGQIGVALDPEPYEVRAVVYSGVGGCDAYSRYSNIVRGTPLSGVPALDAPVPDQSYVEGVKIAELVLPAATGGNGVLTYALVGKLPPGLTIDTATRTLSGMPDSTQTAMTYTWQVTDEDGDTDEVTFAIEVVENRSPVLDAPVPDQSYVEGVKIEDLVLPLGKGGNGELAYALVGKLPPGLTIDTATRRLSGTPDSTQSAMTYTWQVTDEDGDTAEETFAIEVVANRSPVLDAPVPDQSYVEGVQIEDLVLPLGKGGNGDLTYALVGKLPPGLTIDTATRRLSGTPDSTQTAMTYTWQVTDEDGDRDEVTFAIEVVENRSPVLDAPVPDQSYVERVQIADLVLPLGKGGNGELTYALVGELPAGLTIDTATRTLSGTPDSTQAATTYTWQVTDEDGDTDEETFTIEVVANRSPVLDAPVPDQSYVEGVQIADLVLPLGKGGNGELTYALVGELPAGLTIDTVTRTLSGRPRETQAATTYTWRVTDEDGDTDEETFTIEVVADESPVLDAPVPDQSYVERVQIADLVLPLGKGGNGELTYALVGELPAGLTVDTATRTLSGRPRETQAATTYTWRVTDEDGDTDEETFTIEVLEDTVPALAVVPDQVYTRGVAITALELPEATGGNGDLRYELVGALPDGLGLRGRTLSGTPTAVQTAMTYTWKATDADDDVAERTFTIEVVEDTVPVLAVVPDQVYTRGVAITALELPEATGGNGDLRYELVGALPDGLGLRGRTLSGTPTALQVATTYTWKVTDADDDVAERTFTIEVVEDRSPVLDSTVPDQSYVEGVKIAALELPEATGGNGDLTYALVGKLPPGLTIDTATRRVSGTPDSTQSAMTYTWQVTDEDGDTDEETFTIEVVENRSPVLDATVPDQSYVEGVKIAELVLPLGKGGNGDLTYALVGKLPPGLTIDTATRRVSGTPDSTQTAMTYTWQVTDEDGDTDEVTFAIEVVENRSPVLDAPVPDQSYVEGVQIADLVLPFGKGGNGDLTYALVGKLPPGLTIDTATRTLSGTPDSTQSATTYTWQVTDEDGDTDEETFTIEVVANRSPVLDAPVPDQSYVERVQIADLVLPLGKGGNGELTYALVGELPAGLTIDTVTRTLSGRPRETQSATTYTWRVTDEDGDTDEETFTIEVVADESPVLDAPVPDQSYVERVQIADLVLPLGKGGNGELTYALVGELPAGLTVDTATRTLSGRPRETQTATTYTWRVTDEDGDANEETFTIEVLEDTVPVLAVVPDQVYTRGVAITALELPEATGGNGNLAYELVGELPDGLGLRGRTLSGTPTAVQAATTYTWKATDADDDVAERTFTIEVVEDTVPVLAVVPDQVYTRGVAITALELPEATGGNGDLAYELVGALPDGLGLRGRTLSGTPTAVQVATTYTWKVTDADDDVAERTFTIEVVEDRSPVLDSTVPDQSYVEGVKIAELELPAATGGNGDLTYALVGKLPPGLTIDTATRRVSGTPDSTQSAMTYTWQVTDEDGDTDEETFTIEVVENRSPVLDAPVPDQSYVEGVKIEDLVLPLGKGGNGDLTYALVGKLPPGLTIDTATRRVSGTPDSTQTAMTYTWQVTDEDGDTDEVTFAIEVVENRSPVLDAPVPDQSYVEGVQIEDLVLPFGKGGNGDLTYALVGKLPPGLTIDTATRRVSGTPDSTQAATTYTWQVTDEDGDTDEETFTIEVVENRSPVLDAPVPDQSYVERVQIADLVLPAGKGGNGELTYALMGELPAGLTIDTATRTLSGRPRETQAATTYTWRVTDEDGDTDEETFTIEVVADESPVLDAPVPDQSYVERVQIADLVLPLGKGGNGELTYALVGELPAGLTVDTATRTLSGRPRETQTATTYTWRVTDEDGDTDEETFTIEVLEDTVPALAVVPDQVYTRGVAITALELPEATGGNGDLRYELVGALPDGLGLRGRTLSGTPTAVQTATTYTWKATDADDDVAERTFTIEVVEDTVPVLAVVPDQVYTRGVAITALELPEATGGNGDLRYELVGALPDGLGLRGRTLSGTPTALQVATTYTWKVTDADDDVAERTFTIEVVEDRSPVLDSTVPDQSYVEGVKIAELELPAATGGNGDLTYALVGKLPPGLTIDTATRRVSGTPDSTQSAMTYTWQVTDEDGDTDEETFTIEVVENRSPVLDATVPDQSYVEGVKIAELVLPLGKGGNGDLTYALVGKLPPGLTIDTATRRVSGTPDSTQTAMTYTWQVTDEDGDTDEVTFAIEVVENRSPVLDAPVPDQSYVEGVQIEDLVLPFGKGGNGDLTYALVGKLPPGLTIDTATRTLSGTPDSTQSATTYTWQVTDEDGDTDEETFTIEVVANRSPVLDAPVPDQSYVERVQIADLVLPLGKGGNGELTYALVGELPAGLTIDTVTRTLSGRPRETQAATTYTWRVTDEDGDTDEETFTIEVVADESPVLDAPVPDQSYVERVQIADLVLPLGKGGNGELTYALVGELPAGLTVDTATRTLSGRPRETQTATTYTWRVTDEDGDADEETFTIEVVEDTVPVLAVVPDQIYTRGVAITALELPEATGGNGDLAYELVGELPDGLGLRGRTLSGTPTAVQAAATYTWKATDADDDVAERTFTIEVVEDTVPVLAVVPDQVYTRGVAITALELPEATGGNGDLRYELVGALPDGLGLRGRTLSGTPTAVQVATTYTWKVTDADDDVAERTFTIEVVEDRSPVLDATVPDQSYVEGVKIAELALPAATGGNGDLTYALVGKLPPGLTIDTATRRVSGTPDSTQSAMTYTWQVTDEDGDTDEETFTIEVVENRSPVLDATVPDQSYVEGVKIEDLVLPLGKGGNGDLTYALVGKLPPGLTIDTATRRLSGTPDSTQSAMTYTWQVTDEDGDRDEVTFAIEVVENRSPVLDAPVPDQSYVEGVQIEDLVLPFGKGGNGDLTYALVGKLPPGLTIDTATRTLSGTPDSTQAATTYTWQVTDEDGDTDEETFTIEVVANRSPVLDAPVPDQSYVERVQIADLVLPLGKGGNGELTYALVGELPAGLTIDTATRTLSGRPRETQTATTYTWRVTDEDGDTDEETFTIEVVADESPVLDAPVPDQSYVERVQIADLVLPLGKGGNGELTYALVGELPAGLTVDTATRTLSGRPRETQAATTYTWRVTDEDGDTDEETFTIEVLEDTVPVLAVVPDRVYTRGVAITALELPEATGGNGDLRYELVGALPDGLGLRGRTLSGTPAAVQAATTYTWKATDADDDVAERTFTIEVVEDTVPVLAVVPDQVYTRGVAITALELPEATGGNGDLRYELVGALPDGLGLRERTLSGTPTAVQVATTYTWKVTDADDDVAERTFTIEVVEDRSPVLDAPVPDQSYVEGVKIAELELPEATGGNGDLTYALVGKLPPGLTINTATRRLSGTPDSTQSAMTYTWQVTDEDGDTDEETFTIEVVENRSPVLDAPVPDQSYVEGVKIEDLVLPLGKGGNGDLTYALVGKLPPGLTIDTATRRLSGTPDSTQTAMTYTWQVTDEDGDTDEVTFAIEVVENRSPVLDAPVPDQSYVEGVQIADLVLPFGKGGNGDLTYALVGKLPPGLTIDTATRTLSGTPDSTQSATTYTWQVTDEDGDTDEETFTIEVVANRSPVLDAPVPDQSYVERVQIADLVLPLGKGGNGELTYALVGELPAGLTIDTVTRTLSGRPRETQAATTYTWRVTDEDGDTDEETFTIEVVADESPVLDAPVPDQSYVERVQIADLVLPLGRGGNGELTYALVGELPAGLTVDTVTRTLSGRPRETQAATTYTWRVTDEDGDADEETFTIEVLEDTVPALAVVPDQVYTRGVAITALELPEATGGNGDLRYELVGALPDGLGLRGRTLSGTPTAVQAATTYTWKATDADDDVAERTFTIEVVEDTVPVLAVVPDQVYTRGVAITALELPEATGGNGDLRYELVGALPDGLGLRGRTLSGTPTAVQVATTYTWKVTDADDDVAERTFTIEVVEDRSPVLDSTVPDQSYVEGVKITALELPEATGGNGDLAYALVGKLPPGLTINTATRTLSGTPDSTQSAMTYTWQVTDEDGDTDEETFTIEVVENRSPVLDATVPDQSYVEGVKIAELVLPLGKGGNGDLTYALVGKLPPGLTIDTATRRLSGTPDSTQAATTYTWQVTDEDGDTDEVTFAIEVVENRSPVLDAPVPDQSYVEGVQIADLVLPAGKGGNGDLTYALVGKLPPGLTIDTATRTLSGTPDSTQSATTYTWQVTDEDGDTDEETFTIEVVANRSPVLDAPVPDQSYVEGVQIADLVLPAGKGGNGELTYALVGTPPAGLTIDTVTRTLSGRPRETQTATTYTWRVTDEDGDTDEETFTIEVVADESPVLDAPVPDQSYVERVQIADLVLPLGRGGNGELTYALVGELPAGLTVDTVTRTLSGRPRETQAATTYTWRVTDEDGDADEETFTIEVLEDTVPVLAVVPDQVYTRGVAITALELPEATGGNGDLRYELVGELPDGLGLRGRTLSGTPTAVQAATTYTWKATDADDDVAERTFTIEVVEDTVPVLAVVPDQVYTRGVAITVLELPEATGGNGDLAYELVGALPDGLGLRGRTLSGTPTAVQVATTYTWKVTDADDDVAERTFTIEVVEDTVPVLAVIPDQMYTRGVTITALELPEATGGNGELRYELVGELPDGLGLRGRTLSGTPTAVQVATTYTWKVTDADDDVAERTFTIEVVEDTVPALPVVPDQMYTRGVTIMALELPEATGGNGDLRYELVGDLPDGLGLRGRTLSGTPTAVQVATTYTWKATDADDDVAERTFTIEVVEDTVPVLAVIPDQMYTRGVTITALELPEATGGNGDLRYDLVGDLPDGLGLRGRTLSGTPTAVQVATTYTWKVTDADDDVAERTFTIEVVEDTVPALPVVPDQMYTRGVTIMALELPEATGGNGDLRYELVGDLPDGLGLRGRTLSGTPTAVQVATTYTWKATDADDDVAERTFTIEVVEDTVPALAVIPDQMYTRGVAITALELPEATGGNGDLRYELVGDLPDGLGLRGRTLSGTPTAVQAATTYTWKATDADDDVAERTFTIEVVEDTVPALALIPDQMYTRGVTITALELPEATGGNGDLRYELVGDLPDGLGLRGRTLSGTPTAVQAATTYTWKVTDADDDVAERTFTIEVVDDTVPALAVIPDQVYTRGVTITALELPEATGGNGDLRYELVGDLPDGLGLRGRTLSGTPTAVQAATTYTWKATDADDDVAERTFTIEVVEDSVPALAVIPDQMYTRGVTITALELPEATGGNGDLRYELVGDLPDGLGLRGRTLSGTPTAVQAATTYTWKVTDADDDVAERTFTIEVVEDSVPVLAVIPDQMYTRGVTIAALELPEATGGNGDLRYELVGDLPDGLGLRGRTLSGTPTAVQAATTYTWKVTDADDDVAERTFTIEVVEDTVPALAVIPDQVYTRGVTITALDLPEATGGNGDLEYELVGELPDGLGLRGRTLSGTPTAVQAAATYTWKATDADDDVAERTFTIEVVDDTVPALAVIPDQVYTRGVTITALELPEATGGNGDLRYELVGELPDGLGLRGRTLSGTPTAVQVATTYTWKATDADDDVAERTFTIEVVEDTVPALAVIPDQMYTRGVAITALELPEATGGNGDLRYELVGDLPDGLGLRGRTLSGTPTAVQAATTYTWKATDADDDVAERTFTIEVVEDTVPALALIPDQMYTRGVTITALELPEATGGNGDLRYELVGDLPDGLGLRGRTLSGTPTAVQAATTYTWKATDADDDVAERTFTIEVVEDTVPALAVIPDQMYTRGVAITALELPEATGGNGDLRYELVGDLPDGLGLRGRTLSGTPTAVQAATTYTWKATDADDDVAERTFTIEVVEDTVPDWR